MKILVTGSNGFIGKNLLAQLHNIRDGKIPNCTLTRDLTLYEFSHDSDSALLDTYTADCDFVIHLAGVNRSKDREVFMPGNYGITTELLTALTRHNNKSPVLFTSSIQAVLDNVYGVSKKMAEDYLFAYEKETGAKVLIYRLLNVFGKWCKPNYNSVVATFCYNIAHDLPIRIDNPDTDMFLVYIDDVVNEIIGALQGKEHRQNEFCNVPTSYEVKLGKIAELIKEFKESRTNLSVPQLDDSFTKDLYSTYLSYLPMDKFSYPLKMNTDNRGSFTEIIRTLDRGQFSVNISKPGITKGNHWHNTKNEKFVVVSGEGLIQFRRIGTEKVYRYHVNGDMIKVVDIPTGYTHSIMNEGDTDLVTFMWCNECFDSEKPDTYSEEV
ncbi:NAD-dependent epimerase/dehydratase family protein [Megasphaera sueciensis]|uniref:polysaccharide biosynthesis C-terminal domain-containing protein n=1 Tax=Megasphaera sueciensis TaxID=349094 RepID=UPI003CFC759D